MTHTVRCGSPLTDESMQGDFYCIIAASKPTMRGPSCVFLTGHILIDNYGGHRHLFRVTKDEALLHESESLSAAMRHYNRACDFVLGK